jgi:predicted neuraminidase
MIFEYSQRPTPMSHASTIAETSFGLIAAWFGGQYESSPDTGIWISRYDNGLWSKPEEVVSANLFNIQDCACWNPVLFKPKDGPLMLFFKIGPTVSKWQGILCLSYDEGISWSVPRKLGYDEKIKHLVGPSKNKPIQINDTIICPSSTEARQLWRIHFEISHDLGQTWEVIGPINDGIKTSAIQPTILQHPQGRLQALCRTRNQKIYQSWSDDGEKWDELIQTSLPNPNSGIDGITLQNGLQVIVYNHTQSGRTPLNIAVSKNGTDWENKIVLEEEKGEFSYPAIIQTSDLKIHITYSYHQRMIKHIIIEPDTL